MQKRLRIAITGGIGAGKSEVSKIITAAGFPVLYADRIAKELLASSDSVKRKVIDAFGPGAYDGENPNKKYLADNIFNDPENVKKINAIIHPETLRAISAGTDELLRDYPFVFVESALIYEAKREEMFDYVILVYSDQDIRIDRASKGLGIAREEVEERMKHQMSDEEKKKKADFIIRNNDGIDELKKNTEFILKLIQTTAGE